MPIAVIAAINVIRSPALAIMNGVAIQTGFLALLPGIGNHPHIHTDIQTLSQSDQPIGLWVPKHEARLNKPRACKKLRTRLTMTNLLARPNDEPQQIPRP